jgi:hypothetical protein
VHASAGSLLLKLFWHPPTIEFEFISWQLASSLFSPGAFFSRVRLLFVGGAFFLSAENFELCAFIMQFALNHFLKVCMHGVTK